jgi:hypothetical protein
MLLTDAALELRRGAHASSETVSHHPFIRSSVTWQPAPQLAFGAPQERRSGAPVARLRPEGGTLLVRRQWTRLREYTPPKTASAVRRIPLSDELVKFLTALRSSTGRDGRWVSVEELSSSLSAPLPPGIPSTSPLPRRLCRSTRQNSRQRRNDQPRKGPVLFRNFDVCRAFLRWAVTGSNRRPPACKA